MPLPFTVSCFSEILIGLPFWYRFTRVVPEKGPLNARACVYRRTCGTERRISWSIAAHRAVSRRFYRGTSRDRRSPSRDLRWPSWRPADRPPPTRTRLATTSHAEEYNIHIYLYSPDGSTQLITENIQPKNQTYIYTPPNMHTQTHTHTANDLDNTIKTNSKS